MTSSATMKPTVDICVPMYINHPTKYPIVEEFFNSIPEEFNVIVVDDCSPLPHNFPVTYRNEKNLGFTGTVNKLLELSQADVMVVANDDLKFHNDLEWSYGTKGVFYPRDSASSNLDCFGAIWSIDRDSFKKLGYLNESLPHYGSDRDYYDRAIKLGIPVVKINDVCIEHHEGATYSHIEGLRKV